MELRAGKLSKNKSIIENTVPNDNYNFIRIISPFVKSDPRKDIRFNTISHFTYKKTLIYKKSTTFFCNKCKMHISIKNLDFHWKHFHYKSLIPQKLPTMNLKENHNDIKCAHFSFCESCRAVVYFLKGSIEDYRFVCFWMAPTYFYTEKPNSIHHLLKQNLCPLFRTLIDENKNSKSLWSLLPIEIIEKIYIIYALNFYCNQFTLIFVEKNSTFEKNMLNLRYKCLNW